MKKPMSADAALVRLEELCARSEQAVSEVRQKLFKWGIPESEAEKIVESLVDRRFVDDARFAEAFVRDKYRFARWGRHKIRLALIAKRIPRDYIAESLQAIDNQEYARMAFASVQSKLRSLPTDMEPGEKRQRLYRFAIGRGYESSLVVKILSSKSLWR